MATYRSVRDAIKARIGAELLPWPSSSEGAVMEIEFLYVDDCPAYQQAPAELRAALAEAGVTDDIRLLHVTSDAQAQAVGFLGSPTIRVDGADIDPTAGDRQDFGLSCRTYLAADGRRTPVPPRDHIEAAILRSSRSRSSHRSS